MNKQGVVIETNKEYHSDLNAVSKSRLGLMAKTPAYYKWAMENPQEPSEDLVVGSAFHKLVLEPDDFDKEFAVLPEGIDRRTKVGKETYALFMEENADKGVITIEQYEMISKMRDSVLSNPYTVKLLNGKHEQSMYFVDDLTGIQCKVRPDTYTIIGDKVIITDEKSCKSAMPEDFMRDIIKYQYDLQAYMYRLGVAKTLNVPIENVSFVFNCVEKKAPYLSALYEVTQPIFERGEMLFRKYIGMLKECIDTDNWYGYNGFTNAPMTIGIPDWALAKDNEEN